MIILKLYNPENDIFVSSVGEVFGLDCFVEFCCRAHGDNYEIIEVRKIPEVKRIMSNLEVSLIDALHILEEHKFNVINFPKEHENFKKSFEYLSMISKRKEAKHNG